MLDRYGNSLIVGDNVCDTGYGLLGTIESIDSDEVVAKIKINSCSENGEIKEPFEYLVMGEEIVLAKTRR